MSLEAYHASRSIEHQPFRVACYAPWVGLSFDVHGTVSVCAFTRATPLGRIGEVPLAELWRGPAATALREALRRDDLDRSCSRCSEEIGGGNHHGVLARGFDRFRAQDPPAWPTRMEFALTNACNLRCTMCNGEFSSAIRSRREGLPPLPDRYGEAFLDELDPFLPHLAQARFLGGEPFLAPINFRIWERLISLGASPDCNVTTNATVWTPRMEAVMEALPFSVGISLDGVSAATVESIRVGTDHATLLANVERFLAYRERTGASISFTFCLMVANWHELADYLHFADERDCDVYVNTVRQPPRHSLHHLPTRDLAAVLERLEEDAGGTAARLRRNRHVWDEQLARLRDHLARRGSDDRGRNWDALARTLCDAEDDTSRIATLRVEGGGSEPSVLEADEDDILVSGDTYLGIEVAEFHGRPMGQLLAGVAEHLGHRAEVLAEAVEPGTLVRVVQFGQADRSPTTAVSITRRTAGGSRRLAAVLNDDQR